MASKSHSKKSDLTALSSCMSKKKLYNTVLFVTVVNQLCKERQLTQTEVIVLLLYIFITRYCTL